MELISSHKIHSLQTLKDPSLKDPSLKDPSLKDLSLTLKVKKKNLK